MMGCFTYFSPCLELSLFSVLAPAFFVTCTVLKLWASASFIVPSVITFVAPLLTSAYFIAPSVSSLSRASSSSEKASKRFEQRRAPKALTPKVHG